MVSMSACNLIITGFVQGVFFRAETKKKADELGVTGWVRNNADGSVEIHAEGPEDQLEKLKLWCERGPDRARVDHVEVREAQDIGATSFATDKATLSTL